MAVMTNPGSFAAASGGDAAAFRPVGIWEFEAKEARPGASQSAGRISRRVVGCVRMRRYQSEAGEKINRFSALRGRPDRRGATNPGRRLMGLATKTGSGIDPPRVLQTQCDARRSHRPTASARSRTEATRRGDAVPLRLDCAWRSGRRLGRRSFSTTPKQLGLYELMDVKEFTASILGVKADIMTRDSLHKMLREKVEASALQTLLVLGTRSTAPRLSEIVQAVSEFGPPASSAQGHRQ